MENLIDVLTICESKLDASFPKVQFHVDGFSVYRQDSSATSGGVMVYLRSDIPSRRRYEYEYVCHESQSLCIEFTIRKEKWFLLSNYVLPSANFKTFCDKLSPSLDRIMSETSNLIVTGDFNADLLSKGPKFTTFDETLQMYHLKNIITDATCFKSSNATLLDLFIVSKPKRFGSTLNFNCGLSDCQ
jgi:exonuclease III